MVSHFFKPLQEVCLKMARLRVKWLCVGLVGVAAKAITVIPRELSIYIAATWG